MSLQEIERRVRVLEDIEAIKKLKAQYCLYADDNFDPDGMVSLFVEDGVWEGPRGRQEGVEAIRTFFVGMPERLTFALHYALNPIITVNGDEAHGTWYAFWLATRAEGNQAVWNAGRYEEEYVRSNGEWKFREVKLEIYFTTPFEVSWARQTPG